MKSFFISFSIPGTPVTKKNSQQMAFNKKTKRWFPVPSKAYKAYEKSAKAILERNTNPPIDFPINICCVYIFPLNKDGSQPKKKPDLPNLLEATDDILVKYGVIADDNVDIVATHDGSRVVFTNDSEPETYVTITKAKL